MYLNIIILTLTYNNLYMHELFLSATYISFHRMPAITNTAIAHSTPKTAHITTKMSIIKVVASEFSLNFEQVGVQTNSLSSS